MLLIFFPRILCETVKDFITKVSDVSVQHSDEDLNEKCGQLKSKLSHLLDVLKDEQLFSNFSSNVTNLFLLIPQISIDRYLKYLFYVITH